MTTIMHASSLDAPSHRELDVVAARTAAAHPNQILYLPIADRDRDVVAEAAHVCRAHLPAVTVSCHARLTPTGLIAALGDQLRDRDRRAQRDTVSFLAGCVSDSSISYRQPDRGLGEMMLVVAWPELASDRTLRQLLSFHKVATGCDLPVGMVMLTAEPQRLLSRSYGLDADACMMFSSPRALAA